MKFPHVHNDKGSGVICDCPAETIKIGFGMTHDELLAKIDSRAILGISHFNFQALRAVAEFHKPQEIESMPTPVCSGCLRVAITFYPCDIIQAIEKELGE